MSATSASSLILPFLKPNTLSSSNPRSISLSLFSLSHKLNAKPLFCSAFQSFELLAKKSSFSSTFVRNVAVSSEYGQEEDLFDSDDGEVAPSFSADLKVFVGNLPFGVDSSQLADLFGSAGNVELVEVIYDKVTGRSRGFGFVTMSTVKEAEAAAQQFNGYDLEGRSLRVNTGPPPPRREEFSSRGSREGFSSRGSREGFSSRGSRGGFSSRGSREGFSSRGSREGFSPRGERGGASMGASNRVYVGNLSWEVDDSALENLFSGQGEVVEAKVVYDRESGRSRGFGFVTYNSAEEVNGAIRSLDGADLDGRPIRVSVAESRESRPRRQF